jgi:hypothetical protein
MKKQLQTVIKQLEKELMKLRQFPDYDDIVLKPNPPATAKAIDSYEDYLEMSLPKSYRAFLELHNGYEGIAFPGDMLSIQDVMPKSERFDKIQDWKKRMAKYGAPFVLDGIVFAFMGQPNFYVYFDPNKPSGKDELTVVEKDAGSPPIDSENLLVFLEGCLRSCQEGIIEVQEHGPEDADE